MSNIPAREKFENEFLAFKSQLDSYLLRICGNREDAEDISQNAYLKAVHNLQNFLGRSSLKTWVFTIATNLARDHFRARQRWSVNCQDNAREDAFAHPERIDKMKEINTASPAGAFEIREHVDFCFTCMAKTLTLRQQVCVILKDIYEFTLAEIMDITQLPEGKVKHSIADGRQILKTIFQKKCALVSKKGVCYQCSELNDILNPEQDRQMEILKLKMHKEAQRRTSKDHLYRLRTELIKSIDPLQSAGTDLHSYFLTLMPSYSDEAVNTKK